MPRKSSGSDGVVPSKARKLAEKWATDGGSSDSVQSSWSDVDGHLLFSLITLVGNHKGAVMTGVDRQGIGLTLAVWLGGEKVLNKWYNPQKGGLDVLHSDIEEFLTDLVSE